MFMNKLDIYVCYFELHNYTRPTSTFLSNLKNSDLIHLFIVSALSPTFIRVKVTAHPMYAESVKSILPDRCQSLSFSTK